MITLTAFQQITLEQLVSFKAVHEKDIERLLSSDKLKLEAIELCNKWKEQRINSGLEPWT